MGDPDEKEEFPEEILEQFVSRQNYMSDVLWDIDHHPVLPVLPVLQRSKRMRANEIDTAKDISTSSKRIRVSAIDTAKDIGTSSKRAQASEIGVGSAVLSDKEHEQRLEKLKDAGIQLHLPRKLPVSGLAGRLFEHGENSCLSFIDRLGGRDLAVFKIGISANIVQRWSSYQLQNFDFMAVIACLWDPSMIEALEAHLIRLFMDYRGCRNVLRGGESLRTSSGQPRFEGPFYTYITGTPANVRYPIGA